MKSWRSRFKVLIGIAAIIAILIVSVVGQPGRAYAYSLVPFSSNPTGILERPGGNIAYNRIQFDPHGSGTYLVWAERNISQNPTVDDLRDMHDITGMNLATGQSITLATLPGNQTEQAISGPLVVWQDNAHSCPTCEHNILGRNLVTNETFTVGAGPGDQSHPAIAGNLVAWIDFYSSQQQLVMKNLLIPENTVGIAGGPSLITTVLTTTHFTLGRPVMSSEYIVWSEMQVIKSLTNAEPPSHIALLHAYNISLGTVSTIAQADPAYLQYSIADHRVVWADHQLHIADLAAGQSTVLYDLLAESPAIAGNTVIWSSRSGSDSNGLDIYGRRLAAGTIAPIDQPTLLVTGAGNQLGAMVLGDLLAWQNEGGEFDGRVTTTSPLSAIFLSPPQPAPPVSTTIPPTPTPLIPPALPTGAAPADQGPSDASNSPPTVKGMHAPNSDVGWNVGGTTGTHAIDALVDRSTNEPRFGAITVLQNDLDWSTRADAPWGPEVRHAMKSFVYGDVRVIVRTIPPAESELSIYQPNTSGTENPDLDADLVITHLAWRNWMRRIQIENEPDWEWNWSCEGCQFKGGYNPYSWSNFRDYRFYNAIQDWYYEARRLITDYANTCNRYASDPEGARCRNLQDTISIWTPPLNPGVPSLSNGANKYDYLTGMIYNYPCRHGTFAPNCFTYHLYPAPNGGIRNTEWDRFPSGLRYNIDSGWLRTMITEFGWDPGQMGPIAKNGCDYTQDDSWAFQAPPPRPSRCNRVNQGGWGTRFINDIDTIMVLHLHRAETITVWLTSGFEPVPGPDKHNGLRSDGSWKQWFLEYVLYEGP